MCRFLAYVGAPIVMDQLLYQPQNSLIRQSYRSRERAEPLNGDGFGVGWYVSHLSGEPAAFHSTGPAWSNRNLRFNAPKIRSRCLLAHIRAASHGNVSEENCHPFHFKGMLMMHNGQLAGFRKIRRSLRRRLDDETYDWVEGTTDSQHFFALFLTHLLRKASGAWDPGQVTDAIEAAIAYVAELASEHEVHECSSLNLAISNGRWVVASRYTSDPTEPSHTLYHSEGSRFECHDGVCRMAAGDPAQQAVLIVSERLTDVEEDWHEVRPNHFVVVDENLKVSLRPIRG